MISLLSNVRLLTGVGILLTPLCSLAAGDFVPLVGIPFVETTEVSSLPAYANALYIAAISLGAVIAVLKIIFAGIKYMLSDVITDKSKAKQDIRGALIGLIIMIGAVLILNTINPQITQLTALDLEDLSVEGGGGQTIKDKTAEMCNSKQGCTKATCSGTQASVFGLPFVIDWTIHSSCASWCESISGVWSGSQTRTCTFLNEDTNQDNLNLLLDPDIDSEKLVVSISQKEQRDAINDGTYEALLEKKRSEAAALCKVSIDQVKEVIPLGYFGVSYYCPKSSNP